MKIRFGTPGGGDGRRSGRAREEGRREEEEEEEEEAEDPLLQRQGEGIPRGCGMNGSSRKIAVGTRPGSAAVSSYLGPSGGSDVRMRVACQKVVECCRATGYPGPYTVAAMQAGDPGLFVGLLRHVLFAYSRHLVRQLGQRATATWALGDAQALGVVGKLALEEFQVRMPLRAEQCLRPGLAVAKWTFVAQLVEAVRRRHAELQKRHEGAQGARVAGPKHIAAAFGRSVAPSAASLARGLKAGKVPRPRSARWGPWAGSEHVFGVPTKVGREPPSYSVGTSPYCGGSVVTHANPRVRVVQASGTWFDDDDDNNIGDGGHLDWM